jgi:hypothetical protein
MKKIWMFFVIFALLSAQIVKASDIKDATLKDQGKQNEASTIAWLKSVNPEAGLITMSLSQFNTGFKSCLKEFNSKYKTFGDITGDVINNDVIPKLYTADLDPNKLYTVSYWDVKNEKWGRWTRKAKPGETGLFFPGWEEPILSVYCWNFGYPSIEKVTVTVPKVEKPETEIVIIPGTNKYFYKTDTIRERNDTYKEVQNNFFLKTENNNFASTRSNRQSFDVDMSKDDEVSKRDCDCPTSQNRNISHASKRDCGCDNDHICSDHYKKLPAKERKRLGDRTWFRVGTHLVAFAAGWFGNQWIGGNNNGSGNVITQGPLDILPSTVPIFTQGPLWQ